MSPRAPKAMSARIPARRRLVISVEDIRVGVLAERHAEDLARGGGRPDRRGPFGLYG